MKWGVTKRDSGPDLSLDLFRKEVNGFFDDFLSMKPGGFFANDWAPLVDITDKGNAISVIADIPGLSKDDIEVMIEKNMLTICGEKKEERKEEDTEHRHILTERKFGSFRRTIALPGGILTNEINAEFKDGVLSITIPKQEKAQPKKIDIKSN